MIWVNKTTGTITGAVFSPPINSDTGLPLAGWVEVPDDDPEYLTWLNTPPPALPDWATFRQQIAVHPAYLRIASHSTTTVVLDNKLTWVLGQQLFSEVVLLWNAIAQIAQPTSDEITALNTLAASCNVPFSLNSQGMMQ